MTAPLPFAKDSDIQGLYRHYKGNLYRVLGIATHTETEEPHVVYQALYGDYQTWLRPQSMFFEYVETGKGPQPRFTKMDGDAL